MTLLAYNEEQYNEYTRSVTPTEYEKPKLQIITSKVEKQSRIFTPKNCIQTI